MLIFRQQNPGKCPGLQAIVRLTGTNQLFKMIETGHWPNRLYYTEKKTLRLKTVAPQNYIYIHRDDCSITGQTITTTTKNGHNEIFDTCSRNGFDAHSM
jgi:hypothetical protein